MGTYVLTANPDAEGGMDTSEYLKICTEIQKNGWSKATWTVSHIKAADEQEAQKRHGHLTGRVILLRQGGDPRLQGIIAFGERLAGATSLQPGRKMMRIEAPVRFYKASALDELPLVTKDLLKQHGFPQNPERRFQSSGQEITDDNELAALEKCCIEVCGVSLSDLCSGSSDNAGPLRRGGWSTTPDAAHKASVEDAAIACVLRHFHDWRSTDRQKDNCGWDYEFMQEGQKLCVEVKGLSGAEIHVELTPNEFQAMERAMGRTFTEGSYRLAVVCEALSETPQLFLFAHENELDWLCELSQRRITASRRTAARLE